MSTKLRYIITLGIPITLAIAAAIVIQTTILKNQTEFTAWMVKFGPSVILVYVILQTVTIVIAPIGGFFLQIGLLALFEPAFAWSLIYLVTTPLYCVNFLIARK